MSDKTIDEVTPDTNVTGVEKLPVSDGGTPKSMTVNQVKDFVVSKIAALTNGDAATIAADGIYLKRNGVFVPTPASVVVDAAIAYAFDKTPATTIYETDVVSIEQSGAAATISVGDLADYVAASITPDALDFDSLESMTLAEMGSYDVMAIGQYESVGRWTTKKTEIGNVVGYVKARMIDGTAEKVTTMSDSDQFLVITDVGTAQAPDIQFRKMSLGFSGIGAGDVKGPSSNAADKIPQWNGANSKTLKDGLSVASSVTSSSASTEIPTGAAVWGAISTATTYAVKKNSSVVPTTGNIPKWSSASTENTGVIESGYTVSTEVLEKSLASDNSIATEKAVATAVKKTVTIVTTMPAAGATGYEQGELVFCTAAASLGLYVNLGTSSSASWTFIGPAAEETSASA